jgi:hypothetical protein
MSYINLPLLFLLLLALKPSSLVCENRCIVWEVELTVWLELKAQSNIIRRSEYKSVDTNQRMLGERNVDWMRLLQESKLTGTLCLLVFATGPEIMINELRLLYLFSWSSWLGMCTVDCLCTELVSSSDLADSGKQTREPREDWLAFPFGNNLRSLHPSSW